MPNNINPFSNILIRNGLPVSSSSEDIPQNVDAMSIGEQQKTRYSQDTKFRKHLAWWVMGIVPVWLATVLVLLFLQGFSGFTLSDSVLVALLATTTVNVLGLAFIVLRGIFPQK